MNRALLIPLALVAACQETPSSGALPSSPPAVPTLIVRGPSVPETADAIALFEAGKTLSHSRVKGDRERAVESFRAACELKSGRACTRLGSAYDDGKFVTTDDVRAVALYRKACELGDREGCAEFARMHWFGEGVAADRERAQAMLEADCDARISESCLALGLVTKAMSSGGPVVRVLERGCNMGHQPSCALMASEILAMREPSADQGDLRLLFAKACAAEIGVACAAAGRFYVKEEAETGAQLLERGCAVADATSCAALADRLVSGDGTAKDATRAAALHEWACGDGQYAACIAFAAALAKGAGVARDAPRSVALLEATCEAQHVDACTLVAQYLASGKEGFKKNAARSEMLHEETCKRTGGFVSCLTSPRSTSRRTGATPAPRPT